MSPRNPAGKKDIKPPSNENEQLRIKRARIWRGEEMAPIKMMYLGFMKVLLRRSFSNGPRERAFCEAKMGSFFESKTKHGHIFFVWDLKPFEAC